MKHQPVNGKLTSGHLDRPIQHHPPLVHPVARPRLCENQMYQREADLVDYTILTSNEI